MAAGGRGPGAVHGDRHLGDRPYVAGDGLTLADIVMGNSIRRWYGDDEDDARIRAALLLAQMDRFLQLWIVRGLPFERERAVAMLADQWLSVLAPRGRSRSRT